MSGARTLLAALVSGTVVVLTAAVPMTARAAAPAPACGAGLTLEQRAERADDVFTGTIESRTESGTSITWTVTAGQVYKGTVSTRRVAVTTDSRPRECGLPELADGGEYVFFAQERGDKLTAARGSGTAKATAAYLARIEGVLGTGHPAVAPPPAPAEAVQFETVAEEPTPLSRMVAPGLALALAGVLGLLLAAWRGRRRG